MIDKSRPSNPLPFPKGRPASEAAGGGPGISLRGDTAEQRALPEGLYVYYCPICKFGTGDRSWHPVGRAGLIPQTQDEHECVRVDVSALAAEVERLREIVWNLGETIELYLEDHVGRPELEDALEAAVVAFPQARAALGDGEQR